MKLMLYISIGLSIIQIVICTQLLRQSLKLRRLLRSIKPEEKK